MSDTTPLRRGVKKGLVDIETNKLTDHYRYASAGLYANHEYADLSLILKGRRAVD